MVAFRFLKKEITNNISLQAPPEETQPLLLRPKSLKQRPERVRKILIDGGEGYGSIQSAREVRRC